MQSYRLTTKGQSELEKIEKHPDRTELTDSEQSFLMQLKDSHGNIQLDYIDRSEVFPNMTPFIDESYSAIISLARKLKSKGLIEEGK